MSATEELRRLLDEHGVEYTQAMAAEGTLFIVVTSKKYYFILVRDNDTGIEMWSSDLTPEQAIAATLGAGTCRLKRAQWDDGTRTWGCICTACDAHLEHETGIGYSYCPHCGRKVVDE